MIIQTFEATFNQSEETGFFTYIEDEKYEEQGTKLTFHFTDTIHAIKDQIRES